MAISTKKIREEIIENLRLTQGDFLWETGEPLFDIIDSIAELHYKRELIVEITKRINRIEGFRPLLYDTSYRRAVASTLNLLTTSRNVVFPGVPENITNDLDAFIFYYLDRFAETKGYRRRTGSGSSGLLTLTYPNTATTGQFSLILSNGENKYRYDVPVSGASISGTQDQITATVFSVGYGSQYNIPENSLKIDSIIWSDGAINIEDLTINHNALTGGTDYQSSAQFFEEMSRNVSSSNGIGSRNNIAQVLSAVEGVDKYKIMSPETTRFLGSGDIYIKSSSSDDIKELTMLIGDDGKILIPYSPSSLSSITYSGTILIEGTDFEQQLESSVYDNSVREIRYINFAKGVASGTVAYGDDIDLTLEVNTVCINVDRVLNDHFSSYNEFARDFLVHEAQERNVDITMKIRLNIPITRDIVEDLISDSLGNNVGDYEIGEELDLTDLINILYDVTYNNDTLIDGFDEITATDASGTITNTGVLSTNIGEYWKLGDLEVVIA